MLRELELSSVYSPDNCSDFVDGFFAPALATSISYDRVTYTFGPDAFVAASAGVAGLISGGGKMRLVCHCELDTDVLQAIIDGHADAEAAICDAIGELNFDEITDAGSNAGLKLLTWLISQGHLEIKVAVHGGGIFHNKIGIFADERGDRVVFSGSLNETRAGWLHNSEHFSVFRSWEPGQLEYLTMHSDRFQQLWHNRSDGTSVYDIPEALRLGLIKHAPKNRSEVERLMRIVDPEINRNRDRVWRAIAHAVTFDPQTTLETIPATLWPHQLSFWRRYARDAQEPPRVLIADEVGLGKTIQAGALLKTFINRRQAEKVLILVPAVARWQWQQELRHKFNIDIPVLDRRASKLRLVFSDESTQDATQFPWRQADRLILSYDWLRRHQESLLSDEVRFDFVFFDEVHHARYSEVSNPSRRRPNTYLKLLNALSDLTSGLVLLTATPMQIDPVELWALLQLLDREGVWTDESFRRFYDPELESNFENWDWARRLYAQSDPIESPEQIAALTEMSPSEVAWHLQMIKTRPESPIPSRQMDSEKIESSLRLMRRTASIKRSVSRHTRSLLKRYAAAGWLSQTVPERKVSSFDIEMNPQERALYDRIGRFVRTCYTKSGRINRQALGFVMTFYRLRLGSSTYAFRKSLLNLQAKLVNNEREEVDWNEIYESELDSFLESNPDVEAPLPSPGAAIESEISTMLELVERIGDRDSKFEALIEQIDLLRADGYEKVMVFSQFWDTQEWLRGQLASRCRDQFLGGLSGQSNWLLDTSGHHRESLRSEIIGGFRDVGNGILLCTESAAESLNFQFCSAIVNYDIPWNPMRLEQRIGRIDRIGQAKPEIRIIHLFYRDSVEFDAYSAMARRIESFERNVGALQPILNANLERIIKDGVMDDESSDQIEQHIKELETAITFDLDDLASAALDEQDPIPLLRMKDLKQILGYPELFPSGYSIQPSGIEHWTVTGPGNPKSIIVTTDETRHDYAAGDVDYFGPGSSVFPIGEYERPPSKNLGIQSNPVSTLIDSVLARKRTEESVRSSR